MEKLQNKGRMESQYSTKGCLCIPDCKTVFYSGRRRGECSRKSFFLHNEEQRKGKKIVSVDTSSVLVSQEKNFGNNVVIQESLPVYAVSNFEEGTAMYEYGTFIELNEPVTTDTIVITIMGAESGDKYDDTCISEIKVY